MQYLEVMAIISIVKTLIDEHEFIPWVFSSIMNRLENNLGWRIGSNKVREQF